MALWTPSEISAQIIQQIDPDNEATRTIATGFAALNNVIGGTLNYTQSTTSVQPLLVATELNGLDVMRLDGSKMMASPRVLTDDNFSAFCIIKAAAQNNKNILTQNDGGTTVGRMQLLACSNVSPYNKIKIFFNNGSTYSVLGTTVAYDSTWRMIYSESDGAGRTTSRTDGGAEEGTLTGQQWTPMNTTMRLGGVGSTPDLIADIAYILICTKLSADDRQCVEGWLAWRFGLTANLPADHPYKSAAPTVPDGTGLTATLIQPYNLTDPLAAELVQPYSLAVALSANLEQPYSFLLQAYLIQHYGDARQLRAWLIQKYGSVPVLRAWLIQKYGDPLALSAWIEQPWQMSTPLLAYLSQRYGIAAGRLEAWIEQLYHLHENPQLAAALIQPYLIGDQERTTHEFQYEVTIAGVGVSPHVINWDFRRSRYYGTIDLTFKRQDEALLAVDGAELVFVFGGTTYSFLIEGGWEETSDWTTVSYRVAAHSRTKQLGAPYAAPITGQVGPGMASTVLAALVAPHGITLSYEITDVYLPAIEAEDETPIDLIRRILPEQVVLQSGPEGDVLYVQWETEVPVPQWFAVAPAVTIDDLTGFVQTSETSDPQQGFNRFDIIDQQTAEDNSQLVSDQVDDQTIECRLHLSPWNDEIEFELVHTAGSQVTIEPFGVVTRNETETVEIVDGAGRTRYPIDAVIATAWKQQNLGAVTADDDGIIDAAIKRTWDAAHETYTGGDSLLAITYRTRFWRWLVRSPHIDEVQVVALRVTDEVAA